MSGDIPHQCGLVLVLLVFSALYSGTETAITSASPAKLLSIKEDHPFVGRFVDWVINQRQQVLTTILTANNLVNIPATTVGAVIAARLAPFGGAYWAVVVMTMLIVILGEALPKSIALVRPASALPFLLPIVRLTCLVLMPFVWLMTWIVKLLSAVFRVNMTLENSLVTREEIEQVVKIGEASGVLEADERRMIDGIISFEETRVSEVMVPRTDMDLLEATDSIDEVVEFAGQCGRSRIPVYEDTPDNIVGILYVKDLLALLHKGEAVTLAAIMRKPLFVPETMKLQDLFSIMRSQRVHLAIAVDEYGGTAGLVTLEDMLEEIVGEIQDEYDQEKTPVEKIGDGKYRVQGTVCLEDFGKAVEYPFESEEVDTVGGFVLDQFGNFPRQGDTISLPDWDVEVTELEDHRITEVIFTRRHEGSDGE